MKEVRNPRRQRQRNRRREAISSEATALVSKRHSSPEKHLGVGGWCPETRGDWRFVSHAIREGWDTPKRTRRRINKAFGQLVSDPTTSNRLVIAAFRFALQAVRANLAHLR